MKGKMPFPIPFFATILVVSIFSLIVSASLNYWSKTKQSDRSNVATDAQNRSMETHAPHLVIRTWKVPADFVKHLDDELLRRAKEDPMWCDPFAKGGVHVDLIYDPILPKMFETCYKISFPVGTSLEFSPNRGELTVKNTPENIEKIDRLIHSLGPMEMIVIDNKLFCPLERLAMNGGVFPAGTTQWRWHVASEVMNQFIRNCEPLEPSVDPFASDEETIKPSKPAQDLPLADLLHMYGIEFPLGASVSYDRATEMLTSVNTVEETVKIEITFLKISLAVSRAKN